MARKNKNLFFFTDISEVIGTGHFWRSARLAHALGQRHPDARVTMMAPDGIISRRSVESFSRAYKECKITFLFNDHAFLRSAACLDAFEPLFVGFSACFPKERDVTIIDSYRICAEELRHLKPFGRVGVVDDFGHIPDLGGEHVDFVINANHFGAAYTNASHLTVFASPEYHFLSPDLFIERQRNPNAVVIAFGGTDKGHFGLRLLNSMWREDSSALNKFDFKVVIPCPEAEQTYHAPALTTAMKDRLEIVRQYDPADFFGRAGKIICAGGQTVPEAQAAGVRFVGIVSLNKTQTAVCTWGHRQRIEVAKYDGLNGNELKLEMTRFARACLTVLRDDCVVQLPPQNPNGFDRLVEGIWSQVNCAASSPRRIVTTHPAPQS